MQAFYVISLLFLLVTMCAAQSAITGDIISSEPNHPQNLRSLTEDSLLTTNEDDMATAEQRGFGFRRGFRRLRHFGRGFGFFG